jgi:hypothetical protein
MMSPNTYLSNPWNEGAKAGAQPSGAPSKSQLQRASGRHTFTYRIEGLPSGCLLYQLELNSSAEP